MEDSQPESLTNRRLALAHKPKIPGSTEQGNCVYQITSFKRDYQISSLAQKNAEVLN